MTEIRRYTQTNLGHVPDLRGIFALYDEAAAVVAERDAEIERVKASNAALERELERWRHGQQVEGDYVCPYALEANHVRAALADTLRSGETLSEAIWRLKRYCAEVTEERDDARSRTWERGKSLRAENLALAAQVAKTRDALAFFMSSDHWNGDEWIGPCRDENDIRREVAEKALASDRTALEQYVRAAINVAEEASSSAFSLYSVHPMATDSYLKAKAALEKVEQE